MSQSSIRKLEEGDWKIFKEIRLRALKSDPSVFGSNFESESQKIESEWRDQLRRTDVAIFILLVANAPVGMTGISVDRDDESKRTAILWGSWLDPIVRGQGLSKLFYEARIKWAIAHTTVERAIVSHRESNLASKLANQKFGFLPTHISEKIWNDGVTEKEFHYELILNKKR